jgi:hypothetical protein
MKKKERKEGEGKKISVAMMGRPIGLRRKTPWKATTKMSSLWFSINSSF